MFVLAGRVFAKAFRTAVPEKSLGLGLLPVVVLMAVLVETALWKYDAEMELRYIEEPVSKERVWYDQNRVSMSYALTKLQRKVRLLRWRYPRFVPEPEEKFVCGTRVVSYREATELLKN